MRLAAGTEHLEIASYRRLIEKANLTREREVGRLLTETVREEQGQPARCHGRASSLAGRT